MDFGQMFQDPRWDEKKKRLLEVAEWTCQECDQAAHDIHICYYPQGIWVWDYPEDAFKVLCAEHKRERQGFETQIKRMLLTLATNDLGIFLDVLEHLEQLEPTDRSRAVEEMRGAAKRARAF